MHALSQKAGALACLSTLGGLPHQTVVMQASHAADGACCTSEIALEDVIRPEARKAVLMSRIEQFSQLVAQCCFQPGLAAVLSDLLPCQGFVRVLCKGRPAPAESWRTSPGVQHGCHYPRSTLCGMPWPGHACSVHHQHSR